MSLERIINLTCERLRHILLDVLPRDRDLPYYIGVVQEEDDDIGLLPPIPQGPVEYREMLADAVKEACRIRRPYAYVIGTESWFRSIPKEDPDYEKLMLGGSIKDDPKRKECLSITVGGREETIYRAWEIKRDQYGRRRELILIDTSGS